MSWQASLRKATFRDAPFFVTASDGEFGRRTVTHEYPLRDKPYVEDLGRKARTLTFEALVIGANYMAARDRLLQALEQRGPGALVHPYLGDLTVTVTDARLRESTAEGGMARFSIACVESGELTFPTKSVETAARVDESAEFVRRAVLENFARRFTVAGKPKFVADAAGGILGTALQQVKAAMGTVRAQADAVAKLTRDVGSVNAQLAELVYLPASAGQALAANVRALITALTQDPRDALGLARVFFRFGGNLPAVPASTASRAAQAANQAELIQLTRAVAVAEGARAATGLTFDSYQDAVAVRDELAGVMTDLMEGGAEDALYETLRALRSATVRDITQRGADLARLVSFTPLRTQPALVLAHQLYADARRADEIVLRNAVQHPSFVPGAEPLEVLTA